MKKLFFYAAAALAMLASCQKTEINETPSKEIDDTKPVAMQFGVNAPSFQVTKTKAAVDAWSNTEVFVYGLENTSADGYTVLIDNYQTEVVNSETPLAIYQDEATQAPYFYAEGKTYDFFGYHLGGATQDPATPELTDNQVAFKVAFDGSNDVMYAYTDKAEDILKDETAQVMEKDAYSAWAARRNVQPTLVFDHALTRFNFYVRGMNEKSSKVKIEKISALSVLDGTLTVVSKNNTGLGFVASNPPEEITDETVTNVYLKNADDTEFTPTTVENGATYVAGGEGASLILAPDMAQLLVEVEMSNVEFPAIEIPNYRFIAEASQVRKTGLAENAGLTKFEKGTAYNIYINVYGPEEIVITAELTKWADGGDYTYDPDAFRPDGTPSTYVNAEITSVESGTIKASITTSDDVASLRAALKEKESGNLTAYNDVTLATKALGGNVSFTGLDADKIYELVVEYKTDMAADYETADVDVTAPAAATNVHAFGYVFDEESFNEYCNGKLTWYPESTPQSLPWLAVKLSAPIKHANIVVTNVANKKYFKKVFNWEGENITLITISEEELGRKLTPGEWTVTLNGVECKITVPGAETEDPDEEEPVDEVVKKSYVVYDEATYNELPQAYRTEYGDWGTNGLEESLPWLVIETAPGVEATFKFTRENYTETITWTTGVIGCNTFAIKDDELKVDSLVGTWTVEVTIGETTETVELTVPAPDAE